MNAGHHHHPAPSGAHGGHVATRPRGSGTATHFYFERQWNAPAVKILPGEYFVSEEEVVITTVLGSCVSACIWDRTTGIGGMNHFMLPETGEADFTGAAGRFGTYAMELLINDLMKKGARRENLDAKLFGGGNVMKNFTTINVGERNAAFAEKFLTTERIRCSAKDLLDIYPRKVVFFSHSGKCMVKKLKEDRGETVVKLESQYKTKLQVAKPAVSGGDIELF
ncbi:chemoreceptor glutamine deamidase CheD [Derxia lacustris]|uniref:chemoreceptor glutamine deamidase CheD n=1 Tax=Derxia lacustris TaxID=764842 RepID=UPI000A16FABD|nr:chemoreceptor glutamine deamidase CheD [Derxia lacustris]